MYKIKIFENYIRCPTTGVYSVFVTQIALHLKKNRT